MKTSKKLLASAVAASVLFGAASAANAEIELGAGMSVEGFLDMSFVYIDVDGADDSSQTFQIDQFEMDFKYAGSSGISAQVDIEYGESAGGSGEDETFVEQAFITKQVNDNFSVKAGRFLSYSGWEAEEPTGLYQYSGTGYGALFYGGYQQGVSGYYDAGVVDLMVSVVNNAFDPNDSDSESLATEFGVALTPTDALTAKFFYISDEETDLTNIWASYVVSSFTFAAEYNMGEYGADEEADGYLVMGNYASGNLGFTVRYHDFSYEASGVTTFENSAITLSPSYKVGDNLLLVAEVRLDEFGDGVDTVDSTAFALEALFTF